MAGPVFLDDLVDALGSQWEEYTTYVDRETGEVHSVSRETMRLLDGEEDDEGEEGEEDPEVAVARLVLETDRMLALPSPWDVNEWEIMQEFALSMRSDDIRDDLLNAIRGKGAFRYFKDTVRRYRIEQGWYDFRDQALREIAIDWCKQYGLACCEGKRPV